MSVLNSAVVALKRFWGSQPIKMQTAYTGAPGFWSKMAGASASIERLSDAEAYGIGVVYSCITKIASTIAALPVFLYNDSGENFDRIEYYSDVLLNKTPDGVMTAYQFRETLLIFSLLYGKGWAKIIRNRNGEAVRFKVVHSDLVTEGFIDDEAYVTIKTDDGEDVVPYRDMICIRQPLGISATQASPDTISLLHSAQKYANKFFAGGGVMNGVLTSDENLAPEQIDTLLDTWGQQEGKQTRFLPFSVKYHPMGVDPDKAQNVDARRYNSEEICRLFNIPPAMVGLTTSGYKDYENQAKAFVTGTIAPVCERVESELLLKLVPSFMLASVTYRHDLNELMRGDSAARSKFYAEALQNGWMNTNEVRKSERKNPIEGGEVFTKQVNQIALDSLGDYSKKISSDES